MLSFALMPWDFIIIFLLLGVFVPWRGAARVRKLLAQPSQLPTVFNVARRSFISSISCLGSSGDASKPNLS
jgi:hypothetical protein